MSISELERNDNLDLVDPVESIDARRPSPPVELYAAGRQAIDELMTYVESSGLRVGRDRALDFGCGIGHTTQALGHHFDEVDGIELSASMVELAVSYNELGDRCHYHVSRLQHLGPFRKGTFDFVYAGGALEHMRPDNQLRFLSEFHRVLRPGGVAVLDVAPRYAGSMRRMVTRLSPRSSHRLRVTDYDGRDVNFLPAPEVRLQVGLLGARVVADRGLRPGAPTLVERRQFLVQRPR
jgi:SAM-dependent methyltransferase